MSITNDMKKRGRPALQEQPLPLPSVPPIAPPVMDGEILKRLDRIEAHLTRQSGETAALRTTVNSTADRLEHGPTLATSCQEAAAKMTRAVESLTGTVPLMQSAVRRMEEAGTEIIEHREGRSRRLTAALILACALPGLIGNVWVAWMARLL